jgi:N-acetyl-alpha-D-muramate 1-phosphate uridylyltransferase
LQTQKATSFKMNTIEQAMIFAAGLGSRLKPFTDSTPKALVEIAGKTMLERVIENLKNYGIKRIIINVHHFHQKIRTYLFDNKNFGVDIEFSDESEMLLDTGGGLKKASALFDPSKPILLHNVDVLSAPEYQKMIDFHLQNSALATLFVQKRTSSRYFLFDQKMQLSGWVNKKTGDEINLYPDAFSDELAFNGIHIIDPELLNFISEQGNFSIVPVYLRLAVKHKILGFRDDNVPYLDIGKPENIIHAEKIISMLPHFSR